MTTIRLRYLLRPREVTNRINLQVLSVYRDYGVIPKDSRSDNFNKTPEDITRYQEVRVGDLVVNKMKAWQGSVGISAHHGIVSPDYLVCSVDSSINSRFMHHLLRSAPLASEFGARSKGIRPAQWRLYWEDLAEIPINLPIPDEQRRIADFLDAETARIDGLMTKRLAQISVLDELALARIGEHLATAKSNGPVYAYFDVQLGKMLNAERASGDNQQPYLRNANIQWYEINTDDVATMSFEPDEQDRYGLRPGDLLVCEGGYVGQSAVWDGRIPKCYFQKSLHRVRSRSQIPVEWLMYWLRYAKAIGVFEANGNVATIAHLTGEQLAQYRIPIPEDGQRRVAEIGAEIAAIRETQRRVEAANGVLAERRQALITAAVTGGITV
jgi:type I restriction enzyme, S subunit